jgi:bacterioferritin-associated ferredoxin
MADPTPIRACICFSHTFEEIVEMAASEGWTSPEEVAETLGCGTNCGLCRPYIRRALETGQTAFAIMEDDE